MPTSRYLINIQIFLLFPKESFLVEVNACPTLFSRNFCCGSWTRRRYNFYAQTMIHISPVCSDFPIHQLISLCRRFCNLILLYQMQGNHHQIYLFSIFHKQKQSQYLCNAQGTKSIEKESPKTK